MFSFPLDEPCRFARHAIRPRGVETCLSNSFGFGGQNDTLIIRKFRP